MDSALLNTIIGLLGTALTGLIGVGINLLYKKIGLAGMQKVDTVLAQKQTLAILAVKFAQQAFEDLSGKAKFEKAAAFMANLAAEHNITITSDEIEGLIESALKDAKTAFATDWKKEEETTQDTTTTITTTPADTTAAIGAATATTGTTVSDNVILAAVKAAIQAVQTTQQAS